ncbi:MAG TPA: LysR family transcriptional regulator [Kofleriaceae bacterium]|jgi:DNA-binding transcriptional LysR family regulator|nr:LysR family transcriptional regulator [Kofleriaceae bacterium]
MDLNEIAVFTRVVQAGSFTAAAKLLGMPKSTVSRKVADLEERLDARLLQRTTRKLSLTDAGRMYFDHGVRIVQELEAAESAVGSLQTTPRGLLRITVGPNTAWIGDTITGYMKRNPEVQIELLVTGRTVDLVEERFDLGIRAGALADSSLVARKLGSVTWFLVATPGYLKKHRRPGTPDDLKDHDCLLFGAGSTSVTVRLDSGDQSVQVPIAARLRVSDFEILGAAALAGLGIALLPAFQCIDDLRAQRLERVLRDWAPPSIPVHVVYPTARHLSAKVKSFVEYLQQRMTPPPWKLGPMP